MGKLIYGGDVIRQIGVLGVGKSNTGVVNYFKRHYPDIPITVRSDVLCASADFDGERALCEINEDLLFLSPTVRRDRKKLQNAAARGVKLTSDAEFFLDGYGGEVFAVTGSDGKSTTATLAAMMLSDYDGEISAIGNIGIPMTPCLDGAGRAVVAELSSFQLMDLQPKAERAIITNVTPNHLNWHLSYEEYVWAKENVLRRAKERAFNFDCPICREFAEKYGADIVYSYYCGEIELRKSVDARVYITLNGGYLTANGTEILKIDEISCAYEHNIKNFMAAFALTYGHADTMRIRQAARQFKGLAHRCELVGIYDGVRYLNSSIDSSPKRTATTLRSLGGRAIVILGGRSKGLDFGELAPVLSQHASLAVLTGENAREIDAVLSDGTVRIHAGDFEAAVMCAVENARSGDTVILSPASTSFDRFSSFEERGEKFKEIILKHYKGF